MDTQINIWILGAFGKMGSALRRSLEECEDINVTAMISPSHGGELCRIANQDIKVVSSLDEAKQTSTPPEVIVDFTHAEISYESALFSAQNNIHFVSGTTGMSKDQIDDIISAFNNSKANAIIASNFSVGAVLMMHFSHLAAPFFSNMEITEIHHVDKKDKPSGTSKATRAMMSKASHLSEDEIPIHSLRLPGAVAHQQVYFSSQGEILRIEHDSNDRTCFMPGVVMAIRNVSSIACVLFSIESLLIDSGN